MTADPKTIRSECGFRTAPTLARAGMPASVKKIAFRLEQYLQDHFKWSADTFGPGERAEGLCRHIASELEEIRASNGQDLFEWIDVLILAFDGALRAGFSPAAIVEALQLKQETNKTREWRKVAPDQPSFHVKEKNEV